MHELQKKLISALSQLKDHPEAQKFVSKARKIDLFSSFLPLENAIPKMSEKEKQYRKTFWIIEKLLTEYDITIMKDSRNKELHEIALLCLLNVPELQAIYDIPKPTKKTTTGTKQPRSRRG